MTTITITREKLALLPGRYQHHAFKWLYSYSVDGATPVEYGTSIASLRDRLKTKFKGATIVQAW